MTASSARAASALTLGLSVAIAAPASAQTPETAPDSTRTSRNLLGGHQAWLGVAFVSSALATQVDGFDDLDHAVRPDFGRRNALDRRVPRALGSWEIAAGAAAGAYAVGALFEAPTVSRIGRRTIEALAVNAVLTLSLKVGFGRARPGEGDEGGGFSPFSWGSENWSFPSGHTSTAFAWATVLSNELRDRAPFVPYVVYPLAAWAGASRMIDGRHWLTDVTAGALVGVFSAHVIDRWHGGGPLPEPGATRVEPFISMGRVVVVGASLTF